ncbi:protein rolling stone-like [Patiria miniata]|uniref:Rolling stone n=1 Tax=Patiria miniata TaxID=46514 RepID=A0A914ARM6_PATMI|nr:protein rolling stone-like [Patiria miniata]
MAPSCFRLACLNLGFGGESVHRFSQPQAKWPLAPILWCIYRIVLAVYVTVWLVLTVLEWGEPPYYYYADKKAKFLIYASNWSYLVLLLYLVTMAIGNVFYHVRNACKTQNGGDETDLELDPDSDRTIPLSSDDTPSRRKSHQALPWYFKLAWFLHTIACTSGLLVSFSFFIPGQVFNPAGVEPFSVYSFHIHGVNFIIIMLDVILGAVPARILHLVYPVTFALMYFIFTLIYYAAGGLNEHGVTAIYPDFLDWGGLPVGSAVVMIFAVLVASPTVHIIWYLVYRIRDGLSKRCMGCCWTY